MVKFIKKNHNIIFFVILVFLTLFLCIKNYQPGTFLIGWDSLHSEFDLKTSLFRAFWGVWREDQGLGSLAIHSHMADLPRIIIVWVLSLLLPLNLVRYFYIFITIILGTLGIYSFINYLLNIKNKFITSIFAFLGSLFYLLNLGTLQHTFVPFEMFNFLFAFLPWLYLLIIKYLDKGNKKDIFLFGIVTVLSAPIAYAATLFYAYFGGLLVFLFIYNLLKHKKVVFKRSFCIIFISILLNLYWILPNIYSITKSGEQVKNAKINVLFSPEAFIRNEDYGNFKNLTINKSFLFDWRAYNFDNNKFDDLMSSWNLHLNSPLVLKIFYIFSFISLMGLVFSLLSLNKIGISLFGVGLFSLFFLSNLNGPTGGIYSYLLNSFEVFKEGLRTPFTKFSIPFIFVMSYFFAYFFNFFISRFKNRIFKVLLSLILLVGVTTAFVFSMKPSFNGNFISYVVKKEIPNEYFEMFNWFNLHEDGRVAQLPLNTMWGWDYNNWGYQGSGFIGFGIKNPLLIRDYDRWSSQNETFYNQASTALYNKDSQTFKEILNKYQVKYLLLDESIINAGGNLNYLKIDDIKNTLSSLGFIEAGKFGFLTIYDTNLKTSNFIRSINNYSSVNVDLTYSAYDLIYGKYKDYVQNEDGIGYPFSNFDTRGLVDIKIINDKLIIRNNKTKSEVIFPTENKIIETFAINRGFEKAFNCDLQKKGIVERKQLEIGRSYKATDGGVSCDYFNYTNLFYNQSYILRVKGKNIKGRSLKIYLYNLETKRVELEELLSEGEFDQYFVIYSKNSSKSGYTLNVETRSFGRITSENDIDLVEIIPFDISLVNSLYIDSKIDINNTGNLEIKEIKKIGTTIYKVKTTGEGLLVLDQGFEDGWLGFSKINSSWYKLKHLKVNSWANGFIIQNSKNIPNETMIIFWPQFLEWGGFIVLLLTSVGLIVKLRK